MRRQSAPTGLRLAVIFLFAANLKTLPSQYLQINRTSTKEHLVCKKPDSQLCVTWHLGPVDPDIVIKESPSNATQFCGLSDLKRIHPHRKFITVKSLARGGKSKIIFCNGFTKLKGDVVNWKQVEKALNALSRTRRQTGILPRGRYRGQTQSQYLAIDRGNGKDEGKAEAHSAADSSRASVSGNSGMGQAQSQSIYDPNCDDCYGKSDHEVESLKRGPYVPGGGGNRHTPVDSSYGPSGRPGGQVDVSRPGAVYGPGGNGAFGPGQITGGTNIGNGAYGPNDQQSYRPGHGIGPTNSGYGPTLGSTPGVNQGGNGGYVPSGQQGGTGTYIPGQVSGPTSGYGTSLGITPGSNQGVNGLYQPGQGTGSGSSYRPGMTPGVSLGGNGGYGPGQGSGPGTSYTPSPGTTPDVNQGGQIKNTGYSPGQGNGPGSNYGPSSGTIPGGSQGGSYGPGQGSGTSGYVPVLGTPSGVGQNGNAGIIPGSQQGSNGDYRPGTSRYGPSSGTIPSGSIGGNGGYGPSQGNGQNIGYTPGQNGGNGITNYGNQPSNQGVSTAQNQGPGSLHGRMPDGSIYNPGQGQAPIGRFEPGQGGSNGGTFVPQQSYLPGQTNIPGGSYGTVPNGNLGGSGNYPTLQTPMTNSGYGPSPSLIPGSNIPSAPGGNIGYGQTNTNGPSSSGTNWPLALGPYPGPPGSSIYCCVVPNSYGQNVGTGGNILPSTGTGRPSYGPDQMRPGVVGGANEYQVPFETKPNGVPNNLFGPAYGPGTTGTTNGLPQGLIGGPGSQTPYGISNIKDPTSPYGRDSVAPGGQTGLQLPGNFGTGSSGGPSGQNGLLGPTNYVPVPSEGPGGGPGSYGMRTTGGSGGQNGISRPDIYGTGVYGDPRLQHGLQQPGISGMLGNQNGIQGPGSSSGQLHQNGMQAPGNFGTGPTGGSGGQNGIQTPGSFGTGPTGGTAGQNGMQGPGNFGTIPIGSPGRQNEVQVPGNFGIGTNGVSGGPNGIQTPGNFGTGPTGGPGLNEMQGPGNFGTGLSGGSDNRNGLQGPGIFGNGPSGALGGNNGNQGPGIYGTGINGGPGHNGNQGSGIYNIGTTGDTGRPNGLPGTYDTSVGPVGHNGEQIPGGSYGTGSFGGPKSQNGAQGPGSFNGPNVPNNIQTNTGSSGGPGSYIGQNGNTIPGSGPSGVYGGLQPQSNSQGPGAGNTGLYGQAPQGPLNSIPSGNQQRFDSQGNPIQINEYNGTPQNFVDPNSIAIDGDDSEAEAIVNQAANGTMASASSKGGNDKGRAQTHVHGTYTGGGSFQAQAQITGENKEAESEVSGGKKGASSSATGSGRNNKSQASVQLGSETGSIQTQSQSNGVMHSSNSQVQGSVKGGMADAQARGPGSTSSQAQIGFTPYKDGDKTHELIQTPFVGGGIATAQSSGRTGQSQSQLHGTFKYGITYNGAAQSGASLDKDAIFPNRLNFEKIDVFDQSQKNININPENAPNETPSTESIPLSEVPIETKINNTDNEEQTTTEKVSDETMKNSESRYLSHTHLDHHKIDTTSAPSPTGIDNRRSFQSGYENVGTDYEYTTDKDDIQPEEYDTDAGYGVEGNDATDVDQAAGEEFSNYDEYSRDYQTHQSLQSPRRNGVEVQQSTGGNTQHIVLGSLNNHDAEITQRNSEKPDESKVYQPGERVPGTGGYRIPIGFTGSVKSVASKEKTYVVGSKHSPSQAQTVTLTPGSGKVSYVYPPSHGKYINPKELRSLQSQNPKDDRYVSVSKSVTRALDGENNIRKQYSHTYYTKSSSCGYFTFTCTMVSGVDGRKKVCKPKIPTNPDGTPIRC